MSPEEKPNEPSEEESARKRKDYLEKHDTTEAQEWGERTKTEQAKENKHDVKGENE